VAAGAGAVVVGAGAAGAGVVSVGAGAVGAVAVGGGAGGVAVSAPVLVVFWAIKTSAGTQTNTATAATIRENFCI